MEGFRAKDSNRLSKFLELAFRPTIMPFSIRAFTKPESLLAVGSE